MLISTAVVAAAQPVVSQCFKVHSLIKMDEDHYWANWANACPYTIDSVYIMVKFSSRSRVSLGNGVLALHFVVPGTHQVTRFTAPKSVPDFDFIEVRKITTNSEEALLEEPAVPDRQLIADRIPDPGPSPEPGRRLILDNGPAPLSVPASRPRADSRTAAEHNRLGRELLQKGDYSRAIEELSEAIREKSDFSLAYNARGFAYYLSGDYPRALADLDEAIRLNPGYLNAYQNRSRSRKAAGDLAGSAADANKARALARNR